MVVVGHLGRDAVAARIAELMGVTPPAAMVELVREQSGGLPTLVDIVAQALRDTGRFDARHPDAFHRPDLVTVSVALAERLRPQVDELDRDVRALLEGMAVGASLDSEVLGPLLVEEPDALSATVEAARSTGLLTEAGELIPCVRSLFLRLTPVLRRRELQRTLAAVELDRGSSCSPRGGSCSVRGRAAAGSPRCSARRRAAVDGSPSWPSTCSVTPSPPVPRRGRSRAGGPGPSRSPATSTEALRAANRSWPFRPRPVGPTRPSPPRRHSPTAGFWAAASTSTAAWARPPPCTRCRPGRDRRGGQGRAVLATAAGGAGTLSDGAAVLLARGLLSTVSPAAPAALSQLARAAAMLEPVAATVLLPDTPAALTAVVALQCGELSVAQTVLQRALAQRHGGRAASRGTGCCTAGS